MSGTFYEILPERGVIVITGEDRRTFLQGLISNDINKVSADRAIHAAFLTAQGKYLHDFFITEHGDALLLDCEAERLDDLKKRLSMYRLRSKVVVEDASERFAVSVLFGVGTPEQLGLNSEPGAARAMGNGIVFLDPRLADAGARAILPKEETTATLTESGFTPGDEGVYDRLRISLGLPDGSRDMVVDKAILLENGFDELGGVDWNKGCYLGQELTARTKYRGLVKKRLMPVELEGPEPAPGTPVMAGDREVGEIRTARGELALALIRLDALEDASPLTAGDANVNIRKPEWMRL
ncbi:MAG: folate-binding protein [Rhodospirillales bacterium]|nr:folate-binding protein [Rhodospirillales bacterium]MCW8862387.1 folate-binding protein [Rhodospirillales bacterium]MCW8951363.1 folate-binding protein [Rhodospirillales bacterium]MCW8970439.1 folate-binding protein [Rhodospirillales bacterium]MCW9001271.1 folate-binding protein [Rhodospirillales bacterium]